MRQKKEMKGFVQVDWQLLKSEAYKALPPSAAKLLPYFLGQPKKKPTEEEYYQIRFRFPFGRAKHYGFAKSTFNRSLKALIEKGFIEPIAMGRLKGKSKGFNIFRLSDRWKKYGIKDDANALEKAAA